MPVFPFKNAQTKKCLCVLPPSHISSEIIRSSRAQTFLKTFQLPTSKKKRERGHLYGLQPALRTRAAKLRAKLRSCVSSCAAGGAARSSAQRAWAAPQVGDEKFTGVKEDVVQLFLDELPKHADVPSCMRDLSL